MVGPADSAAPRVDADQRLLDRLRAGDQEAFRALVDDWSPAMLRLARTFVGSSQSAQDVVQDAWLGVLTGLNGFQGRSSLRTWTFTILVNRAKTRGVRESRVIPKGSLSDADETGPTVDPGRFQGPGDRYPGGWTSSGVPQPWHRPEELAVARETLSLVERALQDLPVRQRTVVTLRDVQGFSAEEVCHVLEVTRENQRVLLHRGRAALRAALEGYYRRG